MMTEIEGSGATRAGAGGAINEDAYLVEDGLGLYVVCDGLSRAPAGEVAARVAVSALERFVGRAEQGGVSGLPGDTTSRRFAARAIDCAMDAVLEAASSDPSLAGMATTVTMLLMRGEHGVVGHAGDSRAYLIREDRLHQLTLDHEWTATLDRGEGSAESPALIDTFSIALEEGDTFLLCTDGAERVVGDPQLVSIAQALSPRVLAGRIVRAARRDDPTQDATVVVIRVRSGLEPAWLWLSKVPQITTFGHAVSTAA